MYSFLHHPNLSKTENVVLQVILLTLLSCYKLNRCYIKLSLVNILENVFVFIEILFKMLLFKLGVLIYAKHCKCIVLFKVIKIIFQAFQNHHGQQRTSEVSLKEIMHYLSA